MSFWHRKSEVPHEWGSKNPAFGVQRRQSVSVPSAQRHQHDRVLRASPIAGGPIQPEHSQLNPSNGLNSRYSRAFTVDSGPERVERPELRAVASSSWARPRNNGSVFAAEPAESNPLYQALSRRTTFEANSAQSLEPALPVSESRLRLLKQSPLRDEPSARRGSSAAYQTANELEGRVDRRMRTVSDSFGHSGRELTVEAADAPRTPPSYSFQGDHHKPHEERVGMAEFGSVYESSVGNYSFMRRRGGAAADSSEALAAAATPFTPPGPVSTLYSRLSDLSKPLSPLRLHPSSQGQTAGSNGGARAEFPPRHYRQSDQPADRRHGTGSSTSTGSLPRGLYSRTPDVTQSPPALAPYSLATHPLQQPSRDLSGAGGVLPPSPVIGREIEAHNPQGRYSRPSPTPLLPVYRSAASPDTDSSVGDTMSASSAAGTVLATRYTPVQVHEAHLATGNGNHDTSDHSFDQGVYRTPLTSDTPSPAMDRATDHTPEASNTYSRAMEHAQLSTDQATSNGSKHGGVATAQHRPHSQSRSPVEETDLVQQPSADMPALLQPPASSTTQRRQPRPSILDYRDIDMQFVPFTPDQADSAAWTDTPGGSASTPSHTDPVSHSVPLLPDRRASAALSSSSPTEATAALQHHEAMQDVARVVATAASGLPTTQTGASPSGPHASAVIGSASATATNAAMLVKSENGTTLKYPHTASHHDDKPGQPPSDRTLSAATTSAAAPARVDLLRAWEHVHTGQSEQQLSGATSIGAAVDAVSNHPLSGTPTAHSIGSIHDEAAAIDEQDDALEAQASDAVSADGGKELAAGSGSGSRIATGSEEVLSQDEYGGDATDNETRSDGDGVAADGEEDQEADEEGEYADTEDEAAEDCASDGSAEGGESGTDADSGEWATDDESSVAESEPSEPPSPRHGEWELPAEVVPVVQRGNMKYRGLSARLQLRVEIPGSDYSSAFTTESEQSCSPEWNSVDGFGSGADWPSGSEGEEEEEGSGSDVGSEAGTDAESGASEVQAHSQDEVHSTASWHSGEPLSETADDESPAESAELSATTEEEETDGEDDGNDQADDDNVDADASQSKESAQAEDTGPRTQSLADQAAAAAAAAAKVRSRAAEQPITSTERIFGSARRQRMAAAQRPYVRPFTASNPMVRASEVGALGSAAPSSSTGWARGMASGVPRRVGRGARTGTHHPPAADTSTAVDDALQRSLARSIGAWRGIRPAGAARSASDATGTGAGSGNGGGGGEGTGMGMGRGRRRRGRWGNPGK